jgi:hypothetical protein
MTAVSHAFIPIDRIIKEMEARGEHTVHWYFIWKMTLLITKLKWHIWNKGWIPYNASMVTHTWLIESLTLYLPNQSSEPVTHHRKNMVHAIFCCK